MPRPVLAALFVLLGVTAGTAADDPADKKAPAKGLTWLPTVDAGLAQAQRRDQPVFVRASGEDCPWCRKLDEEIAKPDVQQELARWTLVAFDVEQAPREARSQMVGPIPALRILTPTGRLIAKHDGYLPAEQLIAFLKKHHAGATNQAGQLARAGVGSLVEALKDRDPLVREAAVRGLAAQTTAAPRVVEVFRLGGLQPRLAALEVLREWQAPVADLDPWRPETLTKDRLTALARWATTPIAPRPIELTAQTRQEVRDELARLVESPPTEAAAMRERLARRGPAILPEVAARLKDASTDQARERLTALRYRLAASEQLALDWPTGFDRLASTQASVRQQAAQDLARRSMPGDEPVLLELFTNPDPLVREISLRALHELAGPQATAALTRLLADPEPNVRAAVLKQMAERPSPSAVARLTEYLKSEKDPDLVVHAIRVLRATEGRDAIDALKSMTADASWRIRAEATEGLGEILGRQRYSGPDELKNELRQELLKRLEDSDGFVVGRAISALQKSGGADVIEPAIAAAGRHPEIAPAVLKLLGNYREYRAQVIPHLRKFCKHERPEVRAMAITELCNAVNESSEPELRVALADSASVVRQAAAAAFFNLLDGDRSRYQEKPAAGVMNSLLSAFSKPAWHKSMSSLLELMVKSEAPEERFWAGMSLIASAKSAGMLPVVLAVARTDRDLRMHADRLLPWLGWDDRAAFFGQLMAFALPAENSKAELENFISLTENLIEVREPRTLPLLWNLAGEKGFTEAHVSLLSSAVIGAHLGREAARPNGRRRIEGDTKPAVLDATERAKAGSEMQRLVALVALYTVDPDSVANATRPIVADESAPAVLRARAFQIQLLGQGDTADQTAWEGLRSKETAIRRVAVAYFAQHGTYWLNRLSDQLVLPNLNNDDDFDRQRFRPRDPRENAVKLIIPKAPDALKPADLEPLANDPDPVIAAQVAYLRALYGEAEGLDVLLRYWREKAKDNPTWQRLVTRAIAVLDDDSKTSVLEEIYRTAYQKAQHSVYEFYWTIRIMQGPNALRLRQTIRDEVGVENLR